jgi:hypothetical protein
MKLSLTAILFLLAFGARAQSLKLAWDASPDSNVTNYVVYAATNSTTVLTNFPAGTNLTVTIKNLSPATWRFYATAQKDGAESLPSNVVIVQVPVEPANLRTVAVQYTFSLADTNGFHNAVFFKFAFP